jgi:hypothetical protein|nr:MAG TPA: hypothetical protein [Caudoviricetes sp.]
MGKNEKSVFDRSFPGSVLPFPLVVPADLGKAEKVKERAPQMQQHLRRKP